MYKTFRFEGMEVSNHRNWKSAYYSRRHPLPIIPWSVLLAFGAAGMLLPVQLFS